MEIYNRKVGESFPPLIIAEIGINHGGNLEVAKAMVDSAFRCGVEVVKHQTHIVDDEMSSMAKNVKPGNSEKSIYKIMDECSLSESEEYELMEYVKSKGMIFISTPFSRAAADRLNAFGVPAFKIGSGECNNYPLLEHISKFKKPIILSTGMNNIESIKKAVQIFKKYDIQYALLHTTNLYPTPVDLVRLGALKEIMNNFPGIPVGLSDHTTSNLACLSAVALGASILEKVQILFVQLMSLIVQT
jgi:N-acetylneuraminate synthase